MLLTSRGITLHLSSFQPFIVVTPDASINNVNVASNDLLKSCFFVKQFILIVDKPIN